MVNRSANILLISREGEAFAASLIENLHRALGPGLPTPQLPRCADAAAAAQHLAKVGTPHLTLIDLAGASAPRREEVVGILHGIRETDPAASVLLLSEGTPAGAEIMTWLDHGATGLLRRDFHGEGLEDSLREALLQRLTTQRPRANRTPAQHKIRIRLASFEQAVVAETLNIGTGGMFVRFVPPGIQAGDTVEFEFVFAREVAQRGSSEVIERPRVIEKMDDNTAALREEAGRGTGSVAWVRARAAKDSPEGIGVRFVELQPECLRWIEKYVATHRIKAFIPSS